LTTKKQIAYARRDLFSIPFKKEINRMDSILPQESPIVKEKKTRHVPVPLPALPALECQTLSALVQATRFEPIWLAEIERIIVPGSPMTGIWEKEFALHVTARMRNAERPYPICYATFLAARVRGTHTTGWLAYPFESPHSGDTLAAVVGRLVAELRECLVHHIETGPGHRGVRLDARYRLPDDMVWGVRSTHSSIECHNGHWVTLPRKEKHTR
jgi:hypothetical protein